MKQLQLFHEYCQKALSPIPNMAYYNSVALCALDAVFSIRTKYNVVVKILNRFCEHYQIPLMSETPHSMPDVNLQMKVSDIIKIMEDVNAETLATIVNNRQWTSARGKNRILKAEAFLRYLNVFQRHKIETFQDVNAAWDRDNSLESDLKAIPGQNVSVDYFFMLAGNENGVKVDKHLKKFAEDAVGRHPLDNDEIKRLFSEETAYLRKHGYPNMTARHLDHIVWNWQRKQKSKNK